MLSTFRAVLLLTMQCHAIWRRKHNQVQAPVKSHSIKSSLVPVPETPKVLCIRW
jgi:hypothetical protein